MNIREKDIKEGLLFFDYDGDLSIITRCNGDIEYSYEETSHSATPTDEKYLKECATSLRNGRGKNNEICREEFIEDINNGKLHLYVEKHTLKELLEN